MNYKQFCRRLDAQIEAAGFIKTGDSGAVTMNKPEPGSFGDKLAIALGTSPESAYADFAEKEFKPKKEWYSPKPRKTSMSPALGMGYGAKKNES